MKIYNVYVQQRPIQRGQEWFADLVFIGTVCADNYVDAINSARTKTKFPVVEVA